MKDSINDLQRSGCGLDVWTRILADAQGTLFFTPKATPSSENWSEDEEGEDEEDPSESERVAKPDAFKKGASKGIKAAAWMWTAPERPY